MHYHAFVIITFKGAKQRAFTFVIKELKSILWFRNELTKTAVKMFMFDFENFGNIIKKMLTSKKC